MVFYGDEKEIEREIGRERCFSESQNQFPNDLSGGMKTYGINKGKLPSSMYGHIRRR